jgi:hypothetical protein
MASAVGPGFKNLVAMSTDGAPAMCGQNLGAVTLVEEFSGKQVTKYHSNI